jgi:arginase
MGAHAFRQDSRVTDGRRVAIIGAELDLGAGRRGVDMGPSAIRYAGLGERLASLDIPSQDWGNVHTQIRETTDPGSHDARFLSEIRETCERIAEQVRSAAESGLTPLVIGGDHSVAIGTIGALASLHGPGGVLWFDAHGDLNTPSTTPSGNVHGMVLAAVLGRAGAGFESDRWPLPAAEAEHVALIGVRSLDPGERAAVKENGPAVYTISDIDRRGVEPVLREALERVSDASFVHVSVDLDFVDPDVAPGVGSPVRGGVSYREAHLMMELVAESGLLSSLELVEVNPILDHENETARLAVDLAASALGARIL